MILTNAPVNRTRDIVLPFDNYQNCVLYLPFYLYGAKTSKIWDKSKYGHHATITGAILSSTSPGWYFNGVGDGVAVTTNSGIQNFSALTVLVWLNSTAFTGVTRQPFDYGYWLGTFGFMTYADANSDIFVWYLKNTAATQDTAAVTFMPDVSELHGFTWDGTNWWTIRNGVTTAQGAFGGVLGCSSYNLTIGNKYNFGKGWGGIIHEFVLENKYMTDVEIKNYYELTRRRYPGA